MRERRYLRFPLGMLGFVAALLLWQWYATSSLTTSAPIATPLQAGAALGEIARTGALWSATLDTLMMAISGLAAAIALGVLLGITMGISPIANHAMRVPLEFVKPIPPIVLLPIVVLAMGPTMQMGIVLVCIGCFTLIAVQTAAGVFDTDPVALATGYSFGLQRRRVLLHIVLPSTLPYLATAIRVSAPTALIVTVLAGLFGGSPGLGRSLLLTKISGREDQLFAYVLVLGVLGVLFQLLSGCIEKKMLHWHPQYRNRGSHG